MAEIVKVEDASRYDVAQYERLFGQLPHFRMRGDIISWLQSQSVVVLEPHKIKSVTVSLVPPSVCHEVMGLDTMIFEFFEC